MQGLQSFCKSHLSFGLLDGVVVLGSVGEVSVGKPKTWQPKTNPTKRYLSILLIFERMSISLYIAEQCNFQ